MPLVTWTERMSVGIAAIDNQHKQLVSLINDLSEAMRAGKGKMALGAILSELTAYTETHFRYEEKIFAKIKYTDRLNHMQEHENLVARVKDIQAKHDAAVSGMLSIEVLLFLKDWLTTHIMQADKKYAADFRAAGVR